ncbi:MAG: RNA pyrophosphohydrolase [Pseudomonadota bacterium]|nr:RNA pyrophosphohydrolase [Pseudomonadota bacterium]
MSDDKANLPYRPCVGVMLVNGQGLVFVGRRIDTRGQPDEGGVYWQMPQGGIDEGEDLHTAAYRELSEETGVLPEQVTLIAQTREELFYDLPDDLVGKLWKGQYRGQRQHWVLARFGGEDSHVKLDAHDPAEFEEWKWVEPDLLPDLIVPFKKRVYRTVLEEFRDLI